MKQRAKMIFGPRAWVFGVVLALGLAGYESQSAPEPGPPTPGTAPAGGGSAPMLPTPMISPGRNCPPVYTAEDADLPDDAWVVGVVVEGEARAYLLEALSPMMSHVVNDVVADIPVTVTYCDRTDGVRTFTGDADGGPLDVWQGGYFDGLLLRAGNSFYQQGTLTSITPNAAPFPYEPLSHEETTWKAWKEAYPDTDVFTGR
jgi:hypothetical protein